MKYEITSIKPAEKAFPSQLTTIDSPPKELFFCGELPKIPLIAIIGSRKASTYGKQVTELLVKDLVRSGIGIVSGLALGIDGWAHRMALEHGGYTIAVMPCGLDQIYPATHRGLAVQILEKGGGLVSEYPIGTPTLKQHFIARNRLVSGLGLAVVVVEAARKSGTMLTAQFGIEQGREVAAVPGLITAPLSEGTNALIKSGAHLVSNAQDILELCNLQVIKPKRARKPRLDDPHQALIFELINKGAALHGEELMNTSQLDPVTFNQALTMLEISGYIKPLGNNMWMIK